MSTPRPMHRLYPPESGELPPLRLDHLRRMTDDTGILQHAFYTAPDPHFGYATDDNARALLVAVQSAQVTGGEDGIDLAWRYLSFLRYAQRPDGRFRTFLGYDRRWLDEVGSEDSQGRAVWGLGYAISSASQPGMVHSAEILLEKFLPHIPGLSAPRAQAFALIGLGWATQGGYRRDQLPGLMLPLADRLLELWDATADDEWPWFENIIAYSSPKLCEGLLHAYLVSGRPRYAEVAIRGLDFLLSLYFDGHMLDLIGQNGWYVRGGQRAVFDQQPVDAQAVIHGCMAAYQVTGDDAYLARAYDAFAWFLGRNRLGQALYDTNSGGCFDGIHPDRLNGNQGAESTLSYLLSRLAFELPMLPPRGNTTDGVCALMAVPAR